MSTEIKPGQRVVEIDCLERVGTVVPRDEWWDRAQVDRYPDHLVVRLPEGNLALIHPDRLVLVPTDQTTPTQDHGPLAAVLSDRTLAKVLSRPAHDPPSPTKDAIVEAAIRWYEIRNAHAADVTPLQLFDADDALNMAVKAHHAAVTS